MKAVPALVGLLAGACAVVMVGFVVTSQQAAEDAAAAAAGGSAGGTEWDAGNIFSDQVFYNANALPDEPAIQSALNMVGATCLTAGCLRNDTYRVEGLSTQWCRPVPAEAEPRRYAHVLYVLAQACGLNPQVAIAMIQKESQGLTRPTPPAALTGFGCPDSGPGGSANCDSSRAGVWAQTAGLFNSVARGRQDASIINYPEGKTSNILWNVAETSCGASPVTVKNRATAWLYTYTPYQPNAAALAAYPGEGDRCSAYGNRNIFRMFQKWFGSTGGGKPAAGAINAANVAVNGVAVTIPDSQYVAAAVRGKTIQAPSPTMARGLAAGFGALGLPYVWGGGGSGAGPNDGCPRGGGDLNSCQGLTGFDCSGLTSYVLKQAGVGIPGDSGSQRSSGVGVPYASGLAGDIVGFPGHVAIYLGTVDGTPYILGSLHGWRPGARRGPDQERPRFDAAPVLRHDSGLICGDPTFYERSFVARFRADSVRSLT